MTDGKKRRLAAGSALLGVASVAPLTADAAKGSMTAYVIQVVMLMSVVAPLALLALTTNSSSKKDTSWLISGLLQPAAALLIFNTVFIYWFRPSGHRAVAESHTAYGLSLMTITLAAVWLWRPLLRPFSEAPSPMARLGYILLVTVPQTFVGITMALTHPDYAVAGSILALASKSTLFVAFAILFAHVLRESGGESKDGGDNRPLPETPPAPEVPGWVMSIETSPTTPEPLPKRRPVPLVRRRGPLSGSERKAPGRQPDPHLARGD